MAHLRSSSPLTWFLDPLRSSRDRSKSDYRVRAGWGSWIVPVGIGAALLVLSFVGWATTPVQFYFSYLTGWVFCLSISLGAFFFLFFHHLTKASWEIVVRRIAEALLWGFPVLAVLAIPLFFGMHELYHWTHEDLITPGSGAYDEVIAGKHAYLNTTFFFIRMAVYFAIWTFIAHRLYTISVRHDVDPRYETPARLRKVSAWGLPVLAVTTAFASYDLLMSLDPHWFSTIFGVYFFAGAVFVVFAVIALAAMLLQRTDGTLRQTVTVEHYQDLGKWMFGFTVFWGYIAFSQYMLIWYGGLPEETVWFRHRLEHGWGWHSAMLVIMHFVVPFIFLLPRATKRLVPALAFMTVWFVIVHWFDLHWIIMPAVGVSEATSGPAGFHWLNFTTWLGLASIFFGTVVFRLRRHALVPQNDPQLVASLRFENV